MYFQTLTKLASTSIISVSTMFKCTMFKYLGFQCPVYDLVTNVQFSGHYQTVTTKGAITVPRTLFKEPAFFIVVVVQPNDYACIPSGSKIGTFVYKST